MRNNFLLTFCLFILFYGEGISQSKGDMVFDDSVLHVIKFSSEEEPNLYELLQQEAFSFFNRPYHLVKMEFDGQVVDSVGLRAKGFFSSIDENQTPLKIDLNEYIPDQSFDGLKKINLTNSFTDPYRQKDRLSYELFRRAGVAGPRTSYAEVYVNDVFIEMYLIVQQVDKTFIKEHFADVGSLLKIFEPIYGQQDFAPVLGENNANRLSVVNLRNYFKFLLVNQIIQAGDNFPNNNFYVHFSDKKSLFQFIPWDYNLCMQSGLGGFDSLEPQADASEIWNTPEYRDLYLEVACEFRSYLLDGSFLDDLTKSNYNIILSNSQNAIVEDGIELLDYLLSRRTWLSDQLLQEGYNCQSFSYPYEIGDLVINEFAASTDSIGGITEPDGGTPDWIELYNNSDQDIVLNEHFYLSDDIDFPKKWNFKSEVIIPAKGFQIVWADRDVDQQGVHANFKIEKSQGDLLFVYEDMTILDQVSYEGQELNMSYARVPNGTGNFQIRPYTFNANNSTMTSTKEEVEQSIAIFPNPASDFVQIVTSERIKSLQVFSSSGVLLKNQMTNQTRLNVQDLVNGVYFLHIITDKSREVIRLMKV